MSSLRHLVLKFSILIFIFICFTCIVPPGYTIEKNRGPSYNFIDNNDVIQQKIYDNKWAVIIGIDNYLNWPTLECAVNDAVAVKKVLTKYGFENITILTNKQATRNNILFTLGDNLKSKIKTNDCLLVYFAGHGQSEDLPGGGKQGYIIPYEGDKANYYSTCISMEMIRNLSRRISAKHILYIFDSCYSGLGFKRSLGKSPTIKNYIYDVTNSKAVQMITAGKSNQLSGEIYGHGIFTNCLIDALQGKSDSNYDGYIIFSELGNYIQNVVYRTSNGEQTPIYGRFSGEGEFTFELPTEYLHNISENNNQTKCQLRVITNSGGKLFLNSQLKQTLEPYSMALIAELNPGDYNLEIFQSSYEPYKKEISLKHNEVVLIDAELNWAPIQAEKRNRNKNVSLSLGSDAFVVSGNNDYLVVATGRYFPPMFDCSQNVPVGFDIDLINEIAKDIGKKGVKFICNGTIAPVSRNEADLGIGAITITEGRKKFVEFSDYYYKTFQNILVHKENNIYSEPDLQNKKCVVRANSLSQRIASLYNYKTVIVNSKKQIFEYLRFKKADFAIFDRIFLKKIINDYPELRIVDVRLIKESNNTDYYDYYGIIIPKGKNKLLKAVNQSLSDIKKDGRLEEIKRKTFQ